MAYEHKNVIVGAADVYISVKDSNDPTFSSTSPVGPSLPTFTANVKAAAAFQAAPGTTNWRHTGYTTDGIEISYEPDYGEVTVDQALDSVKMFKQGMRVSVNTTFAEATLENLLVAWGQSSNTKGTSGTDEYLAISAGELGDEPVERSLAFVGPAPKAADGKKRERVYHVRRALQVETSAHSLSRTDATTIPVSFRCLPDAGVKTSGQEYGVILQRVIS